MSSTASILQARPTSQLLDLCALTLPTTPMIASEAHFGQIMLNSTVASLPAKVRIRQLATRMLGQELGNVQDTSIQDHPHITFLAIDSKCVKRLSKMAVLARRASLDLFVFMCL